MSCRPATKAEAELVRGLTANLEAEEDSRRLTQKELRKTRKELAATSATLNSTAAMARNLQEALTSRGFEIADAKTRERASIILWLQEHGHQKAAIAFLTRGSSDIRRAPSLGKVWCSRCGKGLRVNAAACLVVGWPVCHGAKMTVR